MPKVTGIFEQFDNLDQVPTENISRGLGPQPLHSIENLLANRLLYPQTAPIKKEDLEIELAILKEIIRINPDKFFNSKEKKLLIPSQFVNRFPDLSKLALSFIDGLNPKGIIHIYLGKEPLGSFVKIEFDSEKDNFEMMVLEKKYSFTKGGLVVIPCNRHCHISFKSEVGRIDGKSEATLEILGGKLGLVVDGREEVI